MDEIDADIAPTPSLKAIFDGAKDFGLTDEEAWQTVDETLCEAGGDATLHECLTELAAALAQRVLSTQRRTLSG
jgi:hypothetical protein